MRVKVVVEVHIIRVHKVKPSGRTLYETLSNGETCHTVAVMRDLCISPVRASLKYRRLHRRKSQDAVVEDR